MLLKLAVSLIIFLAALVGGLLPIILKTDGRVQSWFTYGESFAGGIFLGAGLIHLLPEAQNYLNLVYKTNYPFAFLICALSILALRFIEESAFQFVDISHRKTQGWLAYLLALLLSIHSLVEGGALGVENTFASFLVIFLAIISHKSSEAFALGVSFCKTTMRRASQIQSMILFSLMTPIGILLGALLIGFLHASRGYLTIGIFNAVAAGTFIYIAAFHSISSHFEGHESHVAVIPKIFSFALGLAMMAIVAIWF